MASTYTTNLRLTKQADGENPNSWGQILNDGVISLVDDAIAGYTTVSIGSAATVTLTETQGSGDQSRSAILEFKGTVGGAHDTINVLIPNNSKSYVVKNSVSYNDSTDAIVLKVAGNTGVTITGDSTAMYVTNGTTVLPVAQTTFTNITASGNLDVSGNASVSGNARVGGTLTVAGAVSLASTLSVGGAAYFGSTVTVSGKGKFMTGAFAPIVTLTDATSIALDLNNSNVFAVTLAGNRTLAAPANTSTNIGASGHIFIIQDGTGDRTLSYNSVYQFSQGGVPVLTTASAAVDILFYAVRTTTKVDSILIKNFTR
jgi:hypothetical protein|tara:strand:- start:627 stop:1571 length:945 start_codon:yes stop_codon:yes gene_type:complete